MLEGTGLSPLEDKEIRASAAPEKEEEKKRWKIKTPAYSA